MDETITYKGKEVELIQKPYINDIYYQANVMDQQGIAYKATWEIVVPEEEDFYQACKWQTPDRMQRIGQIVKAETTVDIRKILEELKRDKTKKWVTHTKNGYIVRVSYVCNEEKWLVEADFFRPNGSVVDSQNGGVLDSRINETIKYIIWLLKQ